MSERDTKATTIADLYPGRFLKGGHLMHKGREFFTLTIAGVWREDLANQPDSRKRKPPEVKTIISFRESDMQHLMPKINAVCLREMFGGDVREWVGRKVSLYATDQLMPYENSVGEDRFCVRIYGSPEIERPVRVDYRPPKRKAIRMTMQPTGKRKPEPETTPEGETIPDGVGVSGTNN